MITKMAAGHNQLTLLLQRLCTATRFLTLLPISWRAEEDTHHFTKSLAFFPVVGGMIGAVGSFATFVLLYFFPQPVVIILMLIYLAFISGCLHLDGLSDSADGLLSSRPREESLIIMKDSRAGAMGVVTVVCLFLAKYGALSAMDSKTLCLAVFFMPFAGRCAILLSMARVRYARKEGGLGLLFYSEHSKKAAFWAVSSLACFLAVLAPRHAIPVIAGILMMNFLFNRWCRARLGGATGDTLGAVCELSEMVVAIAFTAIFPLIVTT
jgi:adenosylcobinamide-GDP ribazoletransferase